MVNIYLGLAVNGFFTGIGVISANTFFEWYIKPRLKKIHKKIKLKRGLFKNG